MCELLFFVGGGVKFLYGFVLFFLGAWNCFFCVVEGSGGTRPSTGAPPMDLVCLGLMCLGWTR